MRLRLDAGAGLRQTFVVLIENAVRMKYLLLFAGMLLVFWVLRAALRRRARDAAQNHPQSVTADDMVRCVACGVHLPRGESLTVRGEFFCSSEHQRQHHGGA